MAETNRPPELDDLPQARVADRRPWTPSLVWIIPLVAALVGLWLGWRTLAERGPEVRITFRTAEGVEAGKTRIKYRSVDVGIVEHVELSPDRGAVVVRARLEPFARHYLVDDTRFWVVRARIQGATVEGLGTLLSGAHLGMDAGNSKVPRRDFQGLESAPVVPAGMPGRYFTLVSEDLGSVNVGTPVFYRKLQVGQVQTYELSGDGKTIRVRVFVNAPYDRHVNSQTRFWNASGVDITLDAGGMHVDTESLVSTLVGGIAFQTRGEPDAAQPVANDAEFTLFRTRELAFAYDDRPVPFAFRFRQSVRGLTVGAPIDFQGIVIGTVTDVRVDYDEQDRAIDIVVLGNLMPERLRRHELHRPRHYKTLREGLDLLVANGMRAQLRTGSLITGQLYVALDFVKSAAPARIDWRSNPPVLPTAPGALVGIDERIHEITARLSKVPFDEIGADLQRALKSLEGAVRGVDQATRRIDREITPEAREALRELAETAAALKVMIEYLEQHPEALLRGKPESRP